MSARCLGDLSRSAVEGFADAAAAPSRRRSHLAQTNRLHSLCSLHTSSGLFYYLFIIFYSFFLLLSFALFFSFFDTLSFPLADLVDQSHRLELLIVPSFTSNALPPPFTRSLRRLVPVRVSPLSDFSATISVGLGRFLGSIPARERGEDEPIDNGRLQPRFPVSVSVLLSLLFIVYYAGPTPCPTPHAHILEANSAFSIKAI